MKRKLLITAILCIFIIVIFQYTSVEVLTLQHRTEFSTLYKLSGMVDDIEYLKVMNYSKKSAKVYYVSGGKKAGLLYTFSKGKEGIWKLDQWEAIWSTHGSADGYIWPYYR